MTGVRRGGVAGEAHHVGLALVLSSGPTSGVGMLYWVVAARLVPPAELGLDQVVLVTMMFLGGLAQLNLGDALLRFVPVAGSSARRLVAGSYAVAVAGSLLVAAVFALGAELWAPRLVDAQLAVTAVIALATAPWLPPGPARPVGALRAAALLRRIHDLAQAQTCTTTSGWVPGTTCCPG